MKPIAILLAGALALLLSSSAFIVNENELAILLQFGAVQRTDYKPGLHFKVPFFQNIRKFDRRILTVRGEPERYLTSENKDVLVDFFVKWRISDVGKFYTATTGDESVAEQRLGPIVRQALGKEISGRKLNEVVSGERSNMMEQLREVANAAVKELGIELVDVRVKRIDFPDQISERVFERMRAERKNVANELRSHGTEASEKIRSEADRQRQVLLAEANRDGQQIRGQGDAEAAKIYAGAYQAEPEFYAFHRSLEAYRRAFENKDGVLVLDPKSEFFKYFENGSKR